MLKWIVLDLDGTLLRTDKSVSEYSLSVLAQCRQKGLGVAIATARSEAAAGRVIELVKPDAVISNGGALVRWGEHRIYEKRISAAETDRLIGELVHLPGYVEMSVETESGYFTSWAGSASSDYAHGSHRDFSVPLQMEAYKITVHLKHEAGLSQVAKAHPDCGMLAFSDGPWYRFANRLATKKWAVKCLADVLSISPQEVAAFGDDYNDEEMLRFCGIGVAMENAAEKVKAAADFVCKTNDEDGVALWLVEHVLKKRK